MDKKKQRTPSAPRLEREEQKERTEDRKKIRKTKGAEADASSKITDSELQQQQRKQDELTNSDQSEGNVRMKIGFGAKRTKKPPKSLENFICRPTVRVSQRLSHGDGHGSGGGEGSGPGITGANQSHREIQNKDNNDCVSSKASTSLNPSTPFQTSSKKNDPAVVTPVNTSSKKAPSKQTRKSDTKSLLTSDGPSYAVQPQTDSKVPLSDRITSSTPLKQTYSPPAAPSPPSSLQLNSSPQDSTQVLNIQREKGEDFPTGATMTALISHSLKDMTQKAQTSQQQSPSSSKNDSEHTSFPVSCSEDSLPIKQTPCPQKKNPKIRESNAEKVLNPNEKEDVKKNGNSTGSKNMCNTVTNKRSKENGLVHQPSSSIKTPSLLPALDKSADSSIPENSTSVPELLENKGKNKNHNAKEDLDETRKMTMEPAQITSAAQPKVRNIIDKSKRKSKHSSNQEEDVQCTSDTTSRPDSQLNTPILSTDKFSSDEPPLAKQNINSQKKQKEGVHMTKMTTQVEKMDLAKNANVNSTACKTVPQTSKLKKIPSIKSLKALSSPQFKPRPVGRPPKLKQLQNPSPRSETLAIEHQPKKRGRPKMIRFETPQGKMSHKSSAKPPVPEPSNAPNPEVDLTLPKSTQRKRGRPKRSSSVHPQSSEPPDSSSVNQGAGDNLKPSKAKDTQISSKRNRLIMKTIIKNINKMRVKKRDEVLTQFILGQRQSNKSDFPQKDNEEDADCSVSDATHSLSSLVTSFGGKLGPQINVSKRGTIYMGKRRGRKPKSQRENSDHAAEQTPVLKPQQMAESSNQLNSWSTSGQHKHSFDSQSASLCSSQYTFKHPESLSSTVGCFRKKLYPGNYGYDQHPAPNVTSSQKAKAMPEDKSKPHSSLQSPLPSTTTQLGPVRMQDCRTAHLAQSVLMEQERLKFKGHRKGHICLSRDKIRRHKHKCKRKYLQLRAKRQDPAFLAEVEDLVVRLSEIHIVHQIAQGGCGDDTKNGGRKSVKGKNHPHVLQCLPQNLHHPTMFQINFSGYYSPQSDFSRDSLHYVGMADFKRNNGCPSEPTEHIVTHCPVVHKLGFPLSGGGCYHPPYKMPLSATSFGFGLYRGYPPSATIYPSSPFLPSYVQPYPKNPILSPSKFHKRKHKYLRRDSVLCGGKPQGTYPRVASHPPSDWFSRNSWQREDNREPGRDKRVVDDRLRGNEREGTECLLGQSKLRKDHVNRSSLSSNAPCSSSTLTDKRKTSPLSFIGPAHLRPVSKVRWAEHPQIWRWRGSAPPKQSNSSLNQEAEPGYQEEDTLEGPESDEDLPSPPLSDRTIRHHTFLKNPNLAKSAYSRRTVQRGIGEVLCASRDLMRPGSTLMKEPCTSGEKRASESFHSGGVLFSEHAQHDSPSPTEGQERGRETRPNISRSLFHTNNISPFSSCTARKNSLSHSGNSKTTTLTKGKLKHANNPFKSKIPQSREVTGSEVKKRRPGRPRKNPAPCFSPSLPASPLHHEVTECPAKRKKSERDDHTVLNAIATLAQEEKKRGRKRKDGEKRRDGGQIDKLKDTAEIQDPSHSHTSPSSPSQDASVAVHSQSDRSSSMLPDKMYEWAGLYSDVYKTEDPPRLSSAVNTECLEYDPEEHEHGLFPPPMHVGKYLRLKRIDFQLPYDIYWHCVHDKFSKISDAPLKTATSNGLSGVMSLTQPEDSPCKFHKDNVPHDCISDSFISQRLPAEKAGEEISQTALDNMLPNQSDPHKQPEGSSDAENIPSPLLMMPLSGEERSFVLKHGIFLMRNYEKMRERQALLLREGMREREKENKDDGGNSQSQNGVLGESTNTKSDQHLTQSSPRCENRLSGERGQERSVQNRDLTQTLQGIYDVIVSYKGSSGQTLAAPLLNLCSRKRSGTAPVDLSTLQKQLHSGQYESLELFHSDMLRVFHCAEKYYGCESSVGRNVRQLREVYHSAYQEALTQIGNFL